MHGGDALNDTMVMTDGVRDDSGGVLDGMKEMETQGDTRDLEGTRQTAKMETGDRQTEVDFEGARTKDRWSCWSCWREWGARRNKSDGEMRCSQ